MRNIKNKQSGRSMIEMLGVLAIIGVLSVGGIAGYSKAMHKYRVNKTIEQITLVAGNIRSFFGSQKNYKEAYCYCPTGVTLCDEQSYGDGCPIIRKAKIVPDEMLRLNSDKQLVYITNEFGLSFWFSSADKVQSSDNQAFSIGNKIDNEEACIELLTKDWSASNVNFIRVSQPTGPSSTSVKYKLPISVDVAVEKCSKFITDNKKYSGNGININLYFDVNLNGEAYKDYTWAN